MSPQFLMCLLAFSAPGNEQVIDAFHYPDSRAAARAWVASPGTPPVSVVRDGDRAAVEFLVPFAKDPQLERTILDRAVQLDLAAPGEFRLEIAADDPEPAGHLSLYFRSGPGWYSGSAGLVKRGWQTLSFSKASFRPEGKPAGWAKIDAIRISVWRGAAKDGKLRLGRLAALWHDVALVVPSPALHPGEREVAAALRNADEVAEMLAEIGLGADAVEDAALGQGVLEKRRVAILAYNPRVNDETVAALEQFVKQGGKLMVCYQLPPRLGELLGFARAKYVRPERPDQFSEIRFEADVPGLPKSVKQNSWNITTAEPAGHGARVIGRWHDAEGRPTGQAAMLLSDRGAFFSHVILGDDRAGKKQMLAAVLGHLEPSLWQQMVRGEMARVDKVGHLSGLHEIAGYVKASKNVRAGERLEQALSLRIMAQARVAKQAYPEAVDLARQCHEALADAYLRATPSRTSEGRAFWNHSGTGAYPGDWDRTCKELAAGGFNMVVPNMLWGGLAHYASDVLPRSKTFDEHGDQIAQCVAAGKKHGVEVHVWKVNFNLSTAPKEFVHKMRAAGRTQVSARGEPVDWLCPSHPENVKLEVDSMIEVARKYDVAGLHFDYIRYPDGDSCYCDGCRERFEHMVGKKVAHWPDDCYRGPLRAEYRDFRCKQINRVVEAVGAEARKVKPGIKISAAVFGAYPGCRDSVGQDWVAWIKAGWLDFVCPMDYTESDLSFSVLVSNQLKLVDGKVPVYPGIGATASRSALTPDRVVGQIHCARDLGAAGFTVFNLDRATLGQIVLAVGLGAGSQPAVPPHRSK